MENRIQLNDERDYLVWRRGQCHTVEIFDIQAGSGRRQGKGRQLVKRLVESLTVGTSTPDGVALVYAITRVSNTIAHEFYESIGFRVVGRLHYFYTDGPGEREHALLYGLDL